MNTPKYRPLPFRRHASARTMLWGLTVWTLASWSSGCAQRDLELFERVRTLDAPSQQEPQPSDSAKPEAPPAGTSNANDAGTGQPLTAPPPTAVPSGSATEPGPVPTLEPALSGASDAGSSDAGIQPRPDQVLIDDFEDDDHQALASDGWWYTTNDSTALQALGTVAVDDRPGSYFALHTSGEGFTDWGAFVGLDLGSEQGYFDATPTTAFRFWARSATPRDVVVRFIQQDAASFTTRVALTTEWTHVTLPFTLFTFSGDPEATLDPSIVQHLQLFFGLDPFDVFIDDVEFVTE